MSPLEGERYSVQNPIINYVKEQSAEYVSQDGSKVFIKLGWEYVSPDEALRLRGGKTGLVFKEIFINQMQRLNPGFMDHLLAEDVIKKLETVLPNIEGNFTQRLRNGIRSRRKAGEKYKIYRH